MQLEAVAKIKPVVDKRGLDVAKNQIKTNLKSGFEQSLAPLNTMLRRLSYAAAFAGIVAGVKSVATAGDVVVDKFKEMSNLMDDIATQSNSFKIAPTEYLALTNAFKQLGIGVSNPQEIVKLLENIRKKSIEGEAVDVFNKSTDQYEQVAIGSLGNNILEQLFRLVEIMQARLPDESDSAYTERLQKSVEFIAGGKLGSKGGAAELKDTDLRALMQEYLANIGNEGRRNRVDLAINRAGAENKSILKAQNINQTREIIDFATTSSSNLNTVISRINSIAEKTQAQYQQDLKNINSSVELGNAFDDLAVATNSVKNSFVEFLSQGMEQLGKRGANPTVSPLLQALIDKITPTDKNEIYKNSQGKK